MKVSSALKKIMDSDMSRERKNIFWGNSAMHNAFGELDSLKAQGHTAFRITYKIRRRGMKFDFENYTDYDEAIKGIRAKIKVVGGEAKIADVSVAPADTVDAVLDGLHKTVQKKAHKQKQEYNPYQYKTISVRDLVDFIKENKDVFPNGLDTQIICGDDECNSTYQKLGFQQMTVSDDGENALVITYDMHDTMF